MAIESSAAGQQSLIRPAQFGIGASSVVGNLCFAQSNLIDSDVPLALAALTKPGRTDWIALKAKHGL